MVQCIAAEKEGTQQWQSRAVTGAQEEDGGKHEKTGAHEEPLLHYVCAGR